MLLPQGLIPLKMVFEAMQQRRANFLSREGDRASFDRLATKIHSPADIHANHLRRD